MSRYIFLFDLDATITRQEILPIIAKKIGKYDEIKSITENTMKGELPFKQSFLKRVKILSELSVPEIQEMVEQIPLNDSLVQFITDNKDRCYMATGNLNVWIEPIVRKLGLQNNVFCSKAVVSSGYVEDVFSVVDKASVVQQMVLPFVAVGDGNNDAAMIEAADIGIGYGGVRDIAPSVLECATHAFYDEEKLVDFLNRLL